MSGSGTGTLLSPFLTLSLESFYPYLWRHLPGCPDIIFDTPLIDAVREFCDETWAWMHEADLSVTSGTQEYALVGNLSLLTGSEIVGIYKIEDSDENEFTAYEYDLVLDKFILDEEPTADTTLAITCVLRPQLGVSEIPNWIHNKHKNTIVSGVCKEMMTWPGEQWTNYDLAERHRLLFQNGIAKTKIDRLQGYRKGSMRVQPRNFI